MSATSLRWALLGSIALTLAALAATRTLAYPEPALVARAWELEFTSDAPKPILVRTPDGKGQWYWYLPYKIVNHTGQERLFIPEVTIATDEGDIVTAGKNVPLAVFEAIKKQLNGKFVDSPQDIVGKVLLGEDNAKESVAIWPDFGRDINSMSIFFGGLSGETASIPHPVTQEPVMVAKTLMLQYELPGHTADLVQQTILAGEKKWIMR